MHFHAPIYSILHEFSMMIDASSITSYSIFFLVKKLKIKMTISLKFFNEEIDIFFFFLGELDRINGIRVSTRKMIKIENIV